MDTAHHHVHSDPSSAYRACEDRGKFAINDRYNPSDKIDIADYYMKQNGFAPIGSTCLPGAFATHTMASQ